MPTPTTKYQIAIYSNDASLEAAALKDTLDRRLDELGISSGSVKFFDSSDAHSRDRKAPIVGAYLSKKRNPVAGPSLCDLLADAAIVVPVVKTLADYKAFVPNEIHGLNGSELSASDPHLESVASSLLEGLGLLRHSRRLFISYRRLETQGIAIQLYEALERSGFDVFLDTHSVRPGEDFQEILWHRLADTDVLVLLDSPGFLESRWTEEELAKANSTNIQILQLVWPENSFQSLTAFSRPVLLVEDDFGSPKRIGPDARLTAAKVEVIVTAVESLRARALAARYAYLVQEFYAGAKRVGLVPFVHPSRHVSLQTKSGNHVLAVPTVGIPDAVRYHVIEEEIAALAIIHTEVVLLYDERGIRDKWIEHLAWLDRQDLNVRSLQVSKSEKWLGGLS